MGCKMLSTYTHHQPSHLLAGYYAKSLYTETLVMTTKKTSNQTPCHVLLSSSDLISDRTTGKVGLNSWLKQQPRRLSSGQA